MTSAPNNPITTAMTTQCKNDAPAGMVLASDKRGNRELYYKRHTLRSGRYAWLKVVVDFRDETEGLVVTAFLTDTVRGGDILWMNPELRI